MSNQQHEQICKDLHQTYLIKNADYGDSFKKSLDEDGLIAAVVRMRDKVNRLKSLKDKVGQVDETLVDTALDLANYAIMTAMWIEDSGRKHGVEQVQLFGDNDGDAGFMHEAIAIDYLGRPIVRVVQPGFELTFDDNGEVAPIREETLIKDVDHRGGLIGRDRNVEVDPPFDNNGEIDTTFELSFDGAQIKHVPNIDPTIEYRGADFDGDCVSIDTNHSAWAKKANQLNMQYLDWLEKEKQRAIDMIL